MVIDIKTRVVDIAGITPDLHQAWVQNAVRASLDPIDGFLRDARFLIHDPLQARTLTLTAESAPSATIVARTRT